MASDNMTTPKPDTDRVTPEPNIELRKIFESSIEHAFNCATIRGQGILLEIFKYDVWEYLMVHAGAVGIQGILEEAFNDYLETK
jgi:hypothetical protein